MDGDGATYFKSAFGMGDGDQFLVFLSHPVPIQSLRIITGDALNQDILTDGFVETSPDGVHYGKSIPFDNAGIANATLRRTRVRSLRIRLNRGKGISSLVLREITLQSRTKIAHIQLGPWRGFADISQAPDVAKWAQKAEQQMEAFWPDTTALLYSDQFITPNMVTVIYRTGPNVTDVAATGGGVMEVNSAWCRAHPEDTGLTVHEMSHVIQAYSAYNPVWLVEGIADYIRWIRFEPQNYHARINPLTATYHDSYRTTATFLGWCELNYDSRLVTKLSQDVRFGTYTNSKFKQYCGKDVDTLWTEFIAAYKADPEHIVTPPIAQADRVRPLPAVKADSSVPVDLVGAFHAIGFCADGGKFAVTDGFDGGGAAYSATLLGAMPTSNDVVFHLGPADAANTVLCNGGTIALPTGSHASLWLLGAAVEGNQMGQAFTVTYTDGSTQTLAQHFSDWFAPQRFPGESSAVKMAYRNMTDGSRDPRTFSVYSYGFALDKAKTIKSLTLPDNGNVRLLAISLAD